MSPWRSLVLVAQISAVSLFQLAVAQDQLVQSYSLNDYNRVLDGQWQGIRYASDGNVYFGSSTHSAYHGAAFFKFNPTTQELTLLAEDITIICGEDPNVSPQGKLHSDIVEANGWLYFSTKFSSEKPGAYGGWTGSHVIGYELATGNFRDYGVIHPKYDSYSGIGVDPTRNKIYVFVKSILGNEFSYLYRIDAVTGVKENLGVLDNSLHTSMWIFVDQRGDGWFSLARDGGKLRRVRADTGQLDVFPDALPPLYQWNTEQLDPDALDQDQRWIRWMQPLDGDRALLTLGFDGGMLYMFDSTKPIEQAFTNIKHIGYSYYGLAIGDNSSRVYYYQRANLAKGHQDAQDFHLMSVSLDPADGHAITDHGLIKDQDGRLVWRVPSMMTDGGSRVFMTGDWWTIPGDLGTLRYRHNGVTEYYEQLARGEFFAVADVLTGPSMFVTPSNVNLRENETRQFVATIEETADPSVTWSIDPVLGYVAITGLYTAPSTIASSQTVSVTATSVAEPTRSAAATVTLTPPISVSVAPAEATIEEGQTQQFAATVENASNQAVTWSINPSVGSISPAGLYAAPPGVAAIETVTVTASSVEDPTKSAAATLTLTPAAAPGPSVVRINAGLINHDYTDTNGAFWSRDEHFQGGQNVAGSGITGTDDVTLYRIAREGIYGGGFTYSIPAANGAHTVTLKFAEFKMSQAGQRIFNVAVNGQLVLESFDILAETARNVAFDKSFPVDVSNGTIDIAFARVRSVPIVSAIEIVGSGPPPVDETPPVRSNGAPSGSLPSGTTQTEMSLATDENAECRYSLVAGTAFSAMAGVFTTTGGLAHATTVSGLADGQTYDFFVRCEDGLGNANTNDFPITFSVENPAPPTIAVTAPSAGSTVGGIQTIQAAVTGQGILGVTFFVNGQQLGVEDTAAPFSISWDTTLDSEGPAALTARLRYGSPQQTLDAAAVNVTVDNSGPPPGATTLRLNAGTGVAHTDTLGQVWQGDQYFTGGGQVGAPTVSGTPEVQLYRKARTGFYSDFGWDIPVDNGQYTLTLKFAETTYSAVGQRIFDVVVNGTTVLDDFDVVAAAGAWRTAHDESFNVDVTSGVIDIDFISGNRFGIVSAIEVVGSGPPPVDTTPPARSNGAPSGVLPAGTTQATLALSTDEDASCRYSTAPGTAYLAMTDIFATTGGQAHQTPLAGLVDGQAYDYYVRCADGLGNANTDDFTISFSIDVPAPPSIAITAPADGATVSGQTTITADATGPDIHGVTFLVDGVQQGAEDTTAPFSISWDSTTAVDGPAALTARLRYDSPEQTLDSAAVNVTVDNSGPPAGTSVIRINCGRLSGTYTDTLGQVWDTDQFFAGGGTASTSTVSGTPEVHLYRVARSSLYTNFGYAIPVDNGQYTVTLKFAETTYSAVGQRIFDVVLNGTTVLDDFDVIAAAGGTHLAHDESFTVNVTGGLIEIDTVFVNRFGILSAIEITPLAQ